MVPSKSKFSLGVLLLFASQAMARSVPPRLYDEAGLVKVRSVDRDDIRVFVRAPQKDDDKQKEKEKADKEKADQEQKEKDQKAIDEKEKEQKQKDKEQKEKEEQYWRQKEKEQQEKYDKWKSTTILGSKHPEFSDVTLPTIIVGDDVPGTKPTVQAEGMTFKKKGPKPVIMYNFVDNAEKVVIELVDVKTELTNPPSIPQVLGPLYEQFNFTRSDKPSYFNITENTTWFNSNTTLADGEYKILVRALRQTGDGNNPNHWDFWLSYPVTLALQKEDVPFWKNPWIMLAMVLGGMAALGIVGAVIACIRRLFTPRRSTIRTESAFAPSMGAYKKLGNERDFDPRPSTEYKPGGRYS